MGLYASFSARDLGYPDELGGAVEEEAFTVEVDYASACDAFCEVFLEVAKELVPVDTGFLQSTIDAWNDGYTCECEASAEYAQYVEYGTWKMNAQPYFTPALEAGVMAFMEEAELCLDEARDALEEMMQSAMDAIMDTFGAPLAEGGFGFFGGILATVALFIIAFPILVNAYAMMKTIFGAWEDDLNSKRAGMIASGIEVIIT